MTRPKLFWLTCLTTALTGLNAGFFYTWSFTITGGLDLIDPQHAVSAMRSINANIRNGWFAMIFFGSPLTLLICLIAVSVSRGPARLAGMWLAALALMITTLLVTAQLHVPMNNALAAAGDADPARLWNDYSNHWTSWNHLRTTTSTVAFALAIIATASGRASSLVRHG